MSPLFYVKECDSTQDEILNFIHWESSEFLGLYTYCQNNGRGQYGNSWEIQNHLNIAYSLIIEEKASKTPKNLFNFHTALILRDFIANLTNVHVEIKWPNDIIIRNKKISGLIVENKKINNKNYIVIGIGINVLQESFNFSKAGSIYTQTGEKHNLEVLANSLHEYFVKHLAKEISNEIILSRINQFLFRKDMVSCFEIKNVRQNGIINFVDEQGFLHLTLEMEGAKKFFHKEVKMLY